MIYVDPRWDAVSAGRRAAEDAARSGNMLLAAFHDVRASQRRDALLAEEGAFLLVLWLIGAARWAIP